MISPLSLEPLLLALREAGLPVGVAEIDRLRQVFSLQPELADGDADQTRRRLKVWLRALLVKSPQDRATFERICDRWLARAEQDLQFRTLPESPPTPFSLPPPPLETSISPERDWRGWQAAAAILVLVSILVVAWLYLPKATQSLIPLLPYNILPVEEPPPPQPPPKTPAEIRQRTFSSPVATLTVAPSPATWTGWLPLGLGGLALVVAGGLWLYPEGDRWPS